MSPRSSLRGRRGPLPARALGIWLIALLVALVATVQVRSEVEVQRNLAGTDATALAFLIDDLHRANDSLGAETAELDRHQTALEAGGSGAADVVLAEEAGRLRAIEGLAPVHGPGIVLVIDATGLGAADLQDALNNLAAAGAEAISVNDRRVVTGVPIVQAAGGVTVGGAAVAAPWTISAIGDPVRLQEVAALMIQQLRGDRRVRQATYRAAEDVVIRSVISERPYLYAVGA